MNQNARILLASVLLLCTGHVIGQKFHDYSAREILPIENTETVKDGNTKISVMSGFPTLITGEYFPLESIEPEDMAIEYLTSNRNRLGLTADDLSRNIRVDHVRNGLSGYVIRMKQMYQGIDVYQGELTIHVNKKNMVSYVSNRWKYNVSGVNINPAFGENDAKENAITQSGIELPLSFDKSEMVVYAGQAGARLCYKHVVAGQDPSGEWEILTDANSGEIIRSKNLSFFCKHGSHNHEDKHKAGKKSSMVRATGTGNVFDPDPLSSAMATYGDAGFVDGGDANTPELNGELESKMLLDITLNGSTYELKGPYAEITDHSSPFKGLFSQSSSTFNYNRFDDAFEAVNVYYHIDASMRYLNETLGLSIMPTAYPGGVQADPSGLSGSDNSSFSPGSDRLQFGEGGVDDAEDSDVIHHELGHGLHDWVTNGGLSQNNGLSEGCGDYWAASYNRSLGDWTPADPAYYWVFNWDGHNAFWGGRSVNYRPASPAYPAGLVGQIHTDGQIWATCMMDVWDGLGQTKTDMIFWEGIGMTDSSTDQDDAANAVYQAALDMGFGEADLIAVHTPLTACGYELPDLPVFADCDDINLDLTGVVATDDNHYAKSLIDSDQMITNNSSVLYQSGGIIQIFELFEVEDGSIMTMTLADCNVVPKK